MPGRVFLWLTPRFLLSRAIFGGIWPGIFSVAVFMLPDFFCSTCWPFTSHLITERPSFREAPHGSLPAGLGLSQPIPSPTGITSRAFPSSWSSSCLLLACLTHFLLVLLMVKEVLTFGFVPPFSVSLVFFLEGFALVFGVISVFFLFSLACGFSAIFRVRSLPHTNLHAELSSNVLMGPAWHFGFFAYGHFLSDPIKAHRGDADSCWSGHSSCFFFLIYARAHFQ